MSSLSSVAAVMRVMSQSAMSASLVVATRWSTPGEAVAMVRRWNSGAHARGLLERRDVELAHLQHRGHRALGDAGVGVGDELLKAGRHDLPGHPEAVLQPAAWALLAALGQDGPVPVDLLLRLAVDLQGDRLVEGEPRAAVEREEGLAVELEGDRHDGPGLARAGVAVVRDLDDARVREHRRVEARGLLALGVEPQARSDARHVLAPSGGGRCA